MSVLGRAICKIRGRHSWDYMRDACKRCDRTAAEIVAGVMTDERLFNAAAYWRGVEAGQQVSERRLAQARREGNREGHKEAVDRVTAQIMARFPKLPDDPYQVARAALPPPKKKPAE